MCVVVKLAGSIRTDDSSRTAAHSVKLRFDGKRSSLWTQTCNPTVFPLLMSHVHMCQDLQQKLALSEESQRSLQAECEHYRSTLSETVQ